MKYIYNDINRETYYKCIILNKYLCICMIIIIIIIYNNSNNNHKNNNHKK